MKKSDTPSTDKEEKGPILIRPPLSLKEKLQTLADEKMVGGVSLNAYCVDVLTRHVESVERGRRRR